MDALGVMQSNMAEGIRHMFQQTGRVRFLEDAIILHRKALEHLPLRNGDRAFSLRGLAICLAERYDCRGNVADLEEAITLGRSALEICPPGHPDHCISLHNLACDLRKMFAKRAAICDLEEAIEMHRAVLELRPPGGPPRYSSLHLLGLCLVDRYKTEVATPGRAALARRPPGSAGRGTADLDEAIALERETLQLLTPGDPCYDEAQLCLGAYIRMKNRSRRN